METLTNRTMHYLRTKSGQLFRTPDGFQNLGTSYSSSTSKAVEALIDTRWIKVDSIILDLSLVELTFMSSINHSTTKGMNIKLDNVEPAKPFQDIGKKNFKPEILDRMSTWKDDETNPEEIFLFGKFKNMNIYLDGSSGIGTFSDTAKFIDYRDWYNKVKGTNSDYLNAKKTKPWLLFRAKKTDKDLPF